MPSLETAQLAQPPISSGTSPFGAGAKIGPSPPVPGDPRNPLQGQEGRFETEGSLRAGASFQRSTLPPRQGLPVVSGASYSWSYFSGFRNRWVEREFRQFIRPPTFTFTALCLISLVMGGISLLVTPPYNNPIDRIKIGIQWVLFGIAVVVVAADISLLVLVAQKKISRLQHSWVHAHLRAVTTWALLAAKVTWSLQFWECPQVPDPSLMVYCFGSVSSGHVAIYFLAVLLHIPLPHYFGLFVVDTVMELMFGQMTALKGQPVEAQFSRPLLAACLGCITLAITAWNEREYRHRFLDAKCLELERTLNKRRKQEVVIGLSSLCERRDLPSLLSGMPVQYESQDAAILITQVANFVEWRQSQRPITSVHFLGVLYDGIDSKRFEIGQPLQAPGGDSSPNGASGTPPLGPSGVLIDRLWWKGDTYATGVGLMQRSTEKEREVLLRFARWQLRALTVALGFMETGIELQVKFGFGRGRCQSLQVPSATVTRFYSGDAVARAKDSCRSALSGEVQLHRNPLLEELPYKNGSAEASQTSATLDSVSRPYLVTREPNDKTSSNSESTMDPGDRDAVGRSTKSKNEPVGSGIAGVPARSTATLDGLFSSGFFPSIAAGSHTSHGGDGGSGRGMELPSATASILIQGTELLAYLEQNALVDEDDTDFGFPSTGSGSAEMERPRRLDVEEVAQNESKGDVNTSSTRNRRRISNRRDSSPPVMDSLLHMRSFRSLSEDRERRHDRSRTGSSAMRNLAGIPRQHQPHEESTATLLSYVVAAIAVPLSEKYKTFLNERAIQRSPLAGGIAVAYVMLTLGVVVTEDAGTTPSFVCAGLACILGVLMRYCVLRAQQQAGLVLCIMGNTNALLAALVSLLAQPCVLNRNPDPQTLCFAFVGVLLSDGVRPALTVTIGLAWGVAGFLLELNYPAGRERRRVQHIFWSLLGALAMLVLAIDRIIKNRRSFDDFEALAVATARSAKSKDAHEKVLRMLLPPHVVPLYQQLRDDNASAAVTQRAEDVALLSLRLNADSRGEQGRFDLITQLFSLERSGREGCGSLSQLQTQLYLNVMGRVNQASKLNPEVSVIFTDGDTLILGGPLQPPEVELEDLPAASRFANAPLKQLMYEKVATDVSLTLLTLLSEISQLVPVTAVLHRGDALTMIYGEARPMFALQSGAAEISEWLLEALFPQQMCVTEAFLRPFYENYKGLISVEGDDEALIAAISRDVIERVAPSLRIGSPFRCRGKGVGVAKLFPLLRKNE